MPFVSLNMIKSSMCDCLHDRLNNIQWILVFPKYQSILERKEGLVLSPAYECVWEWVLNCFSCVQFCATLWTVACQALLSMGFSRQEKRSGLQCPPPWHLPNSESNLSHITPAMQADSLPLSHQGSSLSSYCYSVTQSCPTLWDLMDCSMPVFPVLHHLQELAQIHIHWVSDALQPSRPLLSPSPPAFNFSQHQGLFQWAGSLHHLAKVLEFQLLRISPSKEYSGLISFRIDWLDLLAVQETLKSLLQHHSSKASIL